MIMMIQLKMKWHKMKDYRAVVGTYKRVVVVHTKLTIKRFTKQKRVKWKKIFNNNNYNKSLLENTGRRLCISKREVFSISKEGREEAARRIFI